MVKLSISLCSIDGCVRRVTGQSLCNLHYRRMRRHGDPLGGRKTFNGEPLAFLEAAIASDTDECILWPFSKGKAGYGTMFLNGEYHSVPRLALEKSDGQPPSTGMVAAHKPMICHNRACINPRHLRWATHAQNSADTILDGTRLLGEKTNSARLTAKEVLEIRNDNRPDADIAEDYSVSRRAISAIRERKSWRWLHG